MILSSKEKSELVDELRTIYTHCVKTGLVPSRAFIKLGQVLKAESSRKVEPKSEADVLYYGTTRKDIESWLEAVETNLEHAGRGGTPYSDKEREFVEDMRSNFESRSGNDRPLSGNQLKWLQALYDRS